MSNVHTNTILIGLGGTGISVLKRLLRFFRVDTDTPETCPPRVLGVYIDSTHSVRDGTETCAYLLPRSQTTFREHVLGFDWALHREKKRDGSMFVHVDDFLEPLLYRIKSDFIFRPLDGEARLIRMPLISDITRDAKRAGCGPWLAWTAGELLDYGTTAADAGRAFISQLVTQESDEETLTVLALLADLVDRSGKSLPHISAHSLRKETVIVTSTVLRDAERAMKWVATLEGEAPIAERFRPLFENELLTFRRCMVDDEPLLRWLGLVATRLVLTESCRAVSGMSGELHAPFVRLVVDWITRDVGTENGMSIFAASKILPLLWDWFPTIMPREAGARLEEADLAVQSSIITSAFDALEKAFRGRKQKEVPDFVLDGDQLRYVPPTTDPWAEFGVAVARVGNRSAVLRAQIEARLLRLRTWRRLLARKPGALEVDDRYRFDCERRSEPSSEKNTVPRTKRRSSEQ